MGSGQNIDHLDVRSLPQGYDMEAGLSIDRCWNIGSISTVSWVQKKSDIIKL